MIRISIVILGLLALLPAGLQAVPAAHPRHWGALKGAALVSELRKGGYVVFVRHATTDLTQEDSDIENLDNCATQRNLSEAGRAEARVIGAAVKRLGLPFGRVLTSPYCRCRETATLAFGRADVSNALYYALGIARTERERLSGELRKLLSTPPPSGTNAAVVSHTANLKETANIWPEPEGVAIVFKPRGEAGFEIVGTIFPAEWEGL